MGSMFESKNLIWSKLDQLESIDRSHEWNETRKVRITFVYCPFPYGQNEITNETEKER